MPVRPETTNGGPVLIVPYMWIGDFVRCHTVIRLLRERNPGLAIDVLTTSVVAPLLDYMPGVRKGIIADLPRKKLAFGRHRALASQLKAEGYAHVLVMPRTWKSALAPCLAGIPLRTGFVGEARFGLINDLRFGERRLPRMVDRCAALALEKNEYLPTAWPLPSWKFRLRKSPRGGAAPRLPATLVPQSRLHQVRSEHRSDGRQSILPGWQDGSSRRIQCPVFGGPHERNIGDEIMQGERIRMRDFTGPDLRNAILGLAAARAVVSNHSGLLHVAAALGKSSVGIFGPTQPLALGTP